ncbi:MAG: aquaporin [Chloroflexota bacterium]
MLSKLGAALVAEAVGTFLFFFVGAGSVVLATHAGAAGPGLVGIALAHGLALAVLVSALGAVSGGHFNPAVTVAVRLAGRIEWGNAVAYVADSAGFGQISRSRSVPGDESTLGTRQRTGPIRHGCSKPILVGTRPFDGTASRLSRSWLVRDHLTASAGV